MSGEELEFKDLTERIIGCAMAVQRQLGPGLTEATYEACLAYELRKAGMEVQQQVGVDLHYGDLFIPNAGRMDLLVDGEIVVELKAVDRLTDAHQAQVFTYLRFGHKRVGLLLNF